MAYDQRSDEEKRRHVRTTATALEPYLTPRQEGGSGGFLVDGPRKPVEAPSARTTLLRSDVGRAGKATTPPDGLPALDEDDDE
jgi:hypothetical protein